MTRQEVAFQHGKFRIVIDRAPTGELHPYVARLWLVDRTVSTMRPLIYPDRRAVEVYGDSEPMAFASAMTFLGQRFGSLSEYAHGCEDFGRPPRAGDPVVMPRP